MYIKPLLVMLVLPVTYSLDFFALRHHLQYYDQQHIKWLFDDLYKDCHTTLAPTVKHPFGILGRSQFREIYQGWLRRIYAAPDIALGRSNWVQYFHDNPKCTAKRHAEPITAGIPDPPSRLVGMLQLYDLMENSICLRIIKHKLALAQLEKQHTSFNVTDVSLTINIGPSSIKWLHGGFYVSLQHASAFATLCAPITLLIILVIRHPRLFAFFFR
ncbi:ORF2a [Kibale red-tailed guenon virus 1]|uniref:ORF2a n=1 Tax=Kibale red-tailed guenon virus 1 TaxID=1965065 RepID=L0CQC5_9NIDO|nr:ORF2a [Kibale red-tailed guenon virus 1]AGA19103.1 ORF2a [Kibale red-tailed guenon virus 1]